MAAAVVLCHVIAFECSSVSPGQLKGYLEGCRCEVWGVGPWPFHAPALATAINRGACHRRAVTSTHNTFTTHRCHEPDRVFRLRV